MPTSNLWPAAVHQKHPWRQTARGGNREDRLLSEITVALPPLIAQREVPLDAALASKVESATCSVVHLDSSGALEALGVLLLRTESVASSKIEHVHANLEDYARALHGHRANHSAVSMVAATDALKIMIDDVGESGRISLDTLTKAHLRLMSGDARERDYAGVLRDMQNWIGGSDHSPRAALFIPPPPETVAMYMSDLVDFAQRDDLPALVQAAVVHAQFESIHPFTDGNGRIGRGLINSILRRRGVTTRVVVPVASALVVHRDRYFDLLTAYRDGDPRAIITAFAAATEIAARESLVTARRLAEIPFQWQSMTAPRRGDSAVAELLPRLLDNPILTAEDARLLIGASPSATYSAIAQLQDVGVLRPLTNRKRDQVWGAGLVLDEIEDLGMRIGSAAR